jgi:hypothetical protein
MINWLDQNSLRRKIGGSLLLAIGLIFLFFLSKNAVRDIPIWFFGESVSGEIEESWYELIEENKGELSFTYFVSYSFIAPNGEKLIGSTGLSAQEWSGLSVGDEIIVVYSSLNPEINRIDDSRFVPLLLCSYLPFVVLTWFFLTNGWNILYAEFKKPETEDWIVEKKLDPEN